MNQGLVMLRKLVLKIRLRPSNELLVEAEKLSTKGAGIHKILIGLRQDRLPVLVVALFVVAAIIIRVSLGYVPMKFSSFLVNLYTIVMALVLIGGTWVFYRLIRDRPPSPIDFLRTEPVIREVISRIPYLIPILFAQAIFMPTFSAMKLLVGKISPYNWDQTFIDWDLALHGDHPWILMQPFLGEPLATALIALVYHIWILYLYLAFPLVCFWKGNAARRHQMLVAYFLCWIVIGVLMANYMASVGPFALKEIVGVATFVPLMEYLRHAGTVYPVLTLEVQDILVRWHHLRDDGLGRGISAMPSMHVSIALLFAIFGWHVSRFLGTMLTAIFVLIMIGSVHLGYHYAVDGYVSIFATFSIWWIAGFLVRGKQVELPGHHS